MFKMAKWSGDADVDRDDENHGNILLEESRVLKLDLDLIILNPFESQGLREDV